MARTPKRTESLSRERIVQAAIELLDVDGEAGLTFRALASRLQTGAGAIYWHLENKDELLTETTNDLIAAALGVTSRSKTPADAIRAIALALFDAIDAHPWVGAQLTRDPSQSAMLEIFERIGAQLLALEVPEKALFAAASTLVNYVIGVAGQNAANARNPELGTREQFLATVVTRWSSLEPATHPFLKHVEKQLRHHDDREQFLAGIDLILAGIDARR